MRTALVTGASREVGLTIAQGLEVNGYQVAVMATRDESFYPESTRALRDVGISCAWYAGDIGKSEDRTRTVRGAAEYFGEIHVLVNDTGVTPRVGMDLLDTTEENFDYVIGTSTKGNMFMTQTVARQMMKQPVYEDKRGTIINIPSCSSQVSSVNREEYYVSKAGISMLTKLFADKLAPEGISVYRTRPEVIHTGMTSQVGEKYTELVEQGMSPIARWGAPEDVTKVVGVFYSDGFCYTAGDYIDVDGGFHIRRL